MGKIKKFREIDYVIFYFTSFLVWTFLIFWHMHCVLPGDNGVAVDEIIDVVTDDDLSETEIVDLSSMPDSSEEGLRL